MLEVNKTRTEREALAQVLKAEIRSKMEQIDTLKLSILKHEYDLYKMYSRLDELDAEPAPGHTRKNYDIHDVNERKSKSPKYAMQAG